MSTSNPGLAEQFLSKQSVLRYAVVKYHWCCRKVVCLLEKSYSPTKWDPQISRVDILGNRETFDKSHPIGRVVLLSLNKGTNEVSLTALS
jgi:hypothetical protein